VFGAGSLPVVHGCLPGSGCCAMLLICKLLVKLHVVSAKQTWQRYGCLAWLGMFS
jgi:hypothetical protein